MLIKRLLLTTSLVVPAALSLAAVAGTAQAQDTFNWSGMYIGASVGSTQSTTSAEVVYGSDDSAGWTDGYFAGDIYQDVENAEVGAYDDNYYELDLGSLDEWVTEADFDNMSWNGSVFGGVQQQFGNIVVGGELRASFGEAETWYSEAWLSSTGDYGIAYCESDEGCEAYTDLPEFNEDGDLWYGYDNVEGDSMGDDDWIDIDGSVGQINTIGFESKIGTSVSAVARVGLAVDRLMVYGLAGPTMARVSAATYASVFESGSIDVSLSDSDSTVDLDGFADYYWNGSVSEDRVGVEVGMGAEYAITDNVILRAEGTYSNFGSLSVTGYSDQTDATYTVTQDMSRVTVQTGILFKF